MKGTRRSRPDGGPRVSRTIGRSEVGLEETTRRAVAEDRETTTVTDPYRENEVRQSERTPVQKGPTNNLLLEHLEVSEKP